MKLSLVCVLLLVGLGGCRERPHDENGVTIYAATPIIVEVSGGRVYDCVRVDTRYAPLIDCKERVSP